VEFGGGTGKPAGLTVTIREQFWNSNVTTSSLASLLHRPSVYCSFGTSILCPIRKIVIGVSVCYRMWPSWEWPICLSDWFPRLCFSVGVGWFSGWGVDLSIRVRYRSMGRSVRGQLVNGLSAMVFKTKRFDSGVSDV
jgi:hypothetical protein